MGVPLSVILSSSGHNVSITTRNSDVVLNSIHSHDSSHIKYIYGDAMDIDFLVECLSRNCYDAIVDFMNCSTELFKERIQIILKSTGHYYFISSARIYANESPLNERSHRILDVCKDEEYLKTDEYALAKARQEDILYSLKHKSWTIIRPYITYSDERLQLGFYEKERWIHRAILGGRIPFSKTILNKTTTMTNANDVAQVLSTIITNSLLQGDVINPVTDESMSWKQVFNIYADVISDQFGKRPGLVEVDESVFLKRYEPSKYQITVDRVYDRKFKNNKLKEILPGFKFTSLKDGLYTAITSYKNKGCPLKHHSWREEAWMDRLTMSGIHIKSIPTLRKKCAYLHEYYFVKQ